MKTNKFLVFKLNFLILLGAFIGYLICVIFICFIYGAVKNLFFCIIVLIFPSILFLIGIIHNYGTITILSTEFIYKWKFQKNVIPLSDLKSCKICYFSAEIPRMTLSIKLTTQRGKSFFLGIEGNIKLLKAVLELLPQRLIQMDESLEEQAIKIKILKKYYDLLKEFLTDEQMKFFLCK